MNNSKLRNKSQYSNPVRRTFLCLCLAAFSLLLCSCSGRGETGQKGYTVQLAGSAGTGYFWNCRLSEEGVVRVETNQRVPDNVSYGTEYPVTFTFFGEHYGEVDAELECVRKYDDSIRVCQTCKLTVDRNNDVTGELSTQKLIIDPGEPGYSFSCTDSTVISWIDREDGTFEISPLRGGSASITLTKAADSDSEMKKLVYNLTVSDDLCFTVKEQQSENSNGKFESLEDLQNSTGFKMPLPEGAEVLEIRGLDGMGYVRFRYLEREFSYVAGNFDMESFFVPGGKTVVVNGISVGFPYQDKSLAGWKKLSIGYYIMAEEKLTDAVMLTVIGEILK